MNERLLACIQSSRLTKEDIGEIKSEVLEKRQTLESFLNLRQRPLEMIKSLMTAFLCCARCKKGSKARRMIYDKKREEQALRKFH